MKRTKEKLRVFLIGTEFFNPGGIQRVNRNLADALSAESVGCPVMLEVFSYADAPSSCAHGAPFHISASAQNRVHLATTVASRLITAPPHLVLFTHVALLKLMPLCRLLAPRARIAVLCHGVEVWEKAGRRITRYLARVDWILSPSQFTLKKLQELHHPANPITHVIPHGLERNWPIGPRSRVVAETPRLLAVCRMTKDDSRFGTKGVDALLEAMLVLRSSFPKIHLTIAGNGDDRPRLEEKRNALQLQTCVEFVGSLNEEHLRAQYARATVFVLPSDMEGFGMVYIEAMSCGLPVVALNAAATPEVVQDGVTGILVKDSRAACLAEAIMALLANKELLQSMSEASRQTISECFCFDQFALRWSRWLKLAIAEQAYLVRHTTGFSHYWNASRG